LIQQITLAPDKLSIQLDKAILNQWLTDQATSEQMVVAKQSAVGDNHSKDLTPLPECVYESQIIHTYDQLTITAAIQIKRCDGKRVITDDKGRDLIVSQSKPSMTLLGAIAKGLAIQQTCIAQQISVSAWLKQQPISEKTRQYVALAFLSPTIIVLITTGKQPRHWTVKRLLEAARLLLWTEQHQLLGLNS